MTGATLVAEVVIETPLLEEAFAAPPGPTFENEALDLPREECPKAVFRAWGGDFGAFEAGLETDPTVADCRLLTEIGEVRIYLEALGRDISVLSIRGGHGGSRMRVRTPDRAALAGLREAARDHGVPFDLDRVYRETASAGGGYGLTEKQRRALVAAWEAGYFEVPRACTLADVAETLGITEQSLSQRLRRGHRTLLGNTLAGEERQPVRR